MPPEIFGNIFQDAIPEEISLSERPEEDIMQSVSDSDRKIPDWIMEGWRYSVDQARLQLAEQKRETS